MPNYTPGELDLLNRIQNAMNDPTISPGSGFSVPFMLAIFARLVTLRDFAGQQVVLNQELVARITQLELRAAYASTDIAQPYLQLTPDSEEL